MNFIVTHNYRERNSCADQLLNLGLTENGFTSWDEFPNI